MSKNKKLERGILLDTHVWIWLYSGAPELANKSIQFIDEAAANGQVFISVISVWEIGVLAAKKRIILRTPIHEWVNEALAKPGVNLAPLTPEMAIESSHLPNGMHGDPADRIIVATARMKKLTLLTRDKKILDYANTGYLQAYEV